MTLKLRFKFKYFLKSVLRLLTQTPHSCIDGVPSYLAQWLLMKCSLKPRFHVADVKTYIQPILRAPLSFVEQECSYLEEWLPMVCCLFDLILFYPSQYFFSQVMSGWLLLCLACHVFFLQSCGHLLGKGWPLGSHVCDVFLCLYYLLSSNTLSWVMCGTWLYRFLTFAFFFTLLKDNMQFHLWGSNPQPTISTQTLYHWILHSHIVWWLRWKFADFCYDLDVKGLGQIYLTNVDVNS